MVAGTLIITFGAAQVLEELLGFQQRALTVVGQHRVHFNAYEPVEPLSPVVNRAQQIGGSADIVQDQLFINLGNLELLLDEFVQRIVIVHAARNSFFKDGWVRRDASDPLVDQFRHLARI